MKEEILFLSEEDVIYIHENQINTYGGQKGIRSQELLESAVKHLYSEFEGIKLYNISKYEGLRRLTANTRIVGLRHICSQTSGIRGRYLPCRNRNEEKIIDKYTPSVYYTHR